MKRGDRVQWAGDQSHKAQSVTIVSINPAGTRDHAEPWAKIMLNLGSQGVSFMCVEVSELSELDFSRKEA